MLREYLNLYIDGESVYQYMGTLLNAKGYLNLYIDGESVYQYTGVC